MKKTFTKFVAGIAAAAALVLAAGCKNQLDYVNDTTALNKFNVAGFKVTGLDAAYNGAAVKLMVNEPGADGKDNYVEEASTTVGYSYTDASGNVVGYQSGTAYVKLATPYLFDGETTHASTYQCYLKVGNTKIQILTSAGKAANASLSIPASPAGTANADLKTKYVDVVVADGVGSFSLVDSESEPINVTLLSLNLDISGFTTSSTAVTIDSAAKTGTNPKYTLTVKGLPDNQNGTSVVLAGEKIAATSGDYATSLGAYWDEAADASKQEASVLCQTIAKNTVSWSFYGDTASWASAGAGPAIKIYKKGDKTAGEYKDKVYFLKTGTSGNFFFPKAMIGQDITVTIDVSKLTKGTDYTLSDPVAATESFTISGVKIYNAPAVGAAGYIAVCEGWVPNNVWGKDTANKITKLNTDGTASYCLNTASIITKATVTPQTADCSVAIQLLNPASDADFWADASKITGNTINTPTYKTSDLNGNDYTYVVVCADKKNSTTAKAYLILSSQEDLELSQTFNVTGIKVVNAPAVGAAGYLAFCENWLPNNVWGSTTTNKVTALTSGNAVLTFASSVSLTQKFGDTTAIQILNPASDDAFWADASKVTGNTINVTAPINLDGKNVTMVITLDKASNSGKVASATFEINQ